MILECWNCERLMERGKVIKHFIFKGKLFVRVKCSACKMHTDVLLSIEDKRDWKVD